MNIAGPGPCTLYVLEGVQGEWEAQKDELESGLGSDPNFAKESGLFL